jgi:hypothetical protein
MSRHRYYDNVPYHANVPAPVAPVAPFGFGGGKGVGLSTLIILILIILQFGKGKCDYGYAKDCDYGKDVVYDKKCTKGYVDNGILFIIAIFFLACCGCGKSC